MEPAARIVTRSRRPVELAPKEYELLLALIGRRGAVASRKTVEADPADPRHILTVRKVGYRLKTQKSLRSKV